MESLADGTNLVDRRFGGGGTGFLSTTLLCHGPNPPMMELMETTCASGGGFLLGQIFNEPHNESVPICSFLRHCAQCPQLVDSDQEAVATGCQSSNCTFSLLKVATAAPSVRDMASCALMVDKGKGNVSLIQDSAEPYILTCVVTLNGCLTLPGLMCCLKSGNMCKVSP